MAAGGNNSSLGYSGNNNARDGDSSFAFPRSFGDNYVGGGARLPASGYTPGAGYFPSQVPGADAALFPASADGGVEYGRGGGYGYAVAANSGQGDSGANNGDRGADGVVLLRYAATSEPRLPDTGVEFPTAAFAGFGALAAIGAALVALGRRRSQPTD